MNSIMCDAPKAAMNFSIGCVGTKRQGNYAPAEPYGIWESEQVPVTPRSLYYKQLSDRLGDAAVQTVTTSGQRQGDIWNALSTWHGDAETPGLQTFAPVQVDAGDDFTTALETVDILATVRYPLPENFPVNPNSWAQISGPGTVSFGDNSAASTSVTFPSPGTYELTYSFSQQDNRDTGNVVTYSDTDSIVVTVSATPNAVATFSTSDRIIGAGEAGAPVLDYYPDTTSGQTGWGGSNGSRYATNVILGYTLPTLPVGTTITSATFKFEITGNRDHSGDDPGLDVYLLNTANPDSTGTDFYYEGANDANANVALVGSTNIPAGTTQVNYADDTQDQSYTLTGDALTLLQSFYEGDHIPDQTEIFFRFNIDTSLGGTSLNRYTIDLASDESSLDISAAIVVVTYADWIDDPALGIEAADRGFTDDPDGDNIANGLEAWFGTHPGHQGQGIAALVMDGSTMTFTHPQSANPPTGLSGYYEWSPNLTDWHVSGEGPTGGSVVTFSPVNNGTVTTVTATASESIESLFVRVGVVEE